MGFAGAMLGTDSGNTGGAGMNYQAGSTTLQQPVTDEMNSQANNQSNAALQQQGQLLNALQGQNGITNQSSVYNQQQALANQLQGVASGTGPNPALAQLNQSTGANVANQASLMAGQRGTSSNAGLLARQAAQQGANIQQQAAGQGATLSAQQQIAGMQALAAQQQALGSTATNQVNQQIGATSANTAAQQQQQQNLLNATAAYNNANVQQQASQNSSNASVSGVTAGSQTQFANGILGGVGAAIGLAKGGVVKPKYADGTLGVQAPAGSFQNNSQVTPASTQSSLQPSASGPKSAAGSFLASSNNPSQSALSSGSNAGGSAIGAGVVKGLGALGQAIGSIFSPGGSPSSNAAPMSDPNSDHYGSSDSDMEAAMDNAAGANMVGSGSSGSDMTAAMDAAAFADGGQVGGQDGSLIQTLVKMAPMLAMMSKGGTAKKVPAMVSPGEAYISPNKLKEAASHKENPLKKAEIIPGKASVKGDSQKNDTVPKTLEEGGIVIPRSVMTSKNPSAAAAKFVAEHLKKQKSSKKV